MRLLPRPALRIYFSEDRRLQETGASLRAFLIYVEEGSLTVLPADSNGPKRISPCLYGLAWIVFLLPGPGIWTKAFRSIGSAFDRRSQLDTTQARS